MLGILGFLTSLAAAHTPEANAESGYVVAANWRINPNNPPVYQLEVTRQYTSSFLESGLRTLIASTTSEDVFGPMFTAFDQTSRTMFVTITNRNLISASLYGLTISSDVNTTKALTPARVTFYYPEADMVMVGMELYTNPATGLLAPLVIMRDGTVLEVNATTGGASVLVDLVDDTKILTGAIETSPDQSTMYLITQDFIGTSGLDLITLNLRTADYTVMDVLPAPGQSTLLEAPFEMVWANAAQSLLVFFTGVVDQVTYLNTRTGTSSWAIPDLSAFRGQIGHLDITMSEDFPDDSWNNACVDQIKNILYFQCSDVGDESSTFAANALCMAKVSSAQTQLAVCTKIAVSYPLLV
jgi:hypothetical protein